VRIGYRAAGLNAFTFDEWKASGGEFTIPHYATPAELKNTPNHFILDVRAESEAKESLWKAQSTSPSLRSQIT
jgi:hypothetical protein